MSEDSQQEKKIIIDEDWKAQVQAEKEQAKHADDERPPAQPDNGPEEMPLPPAEFPTLVSMLATQAMVCLGGIPNPMSGKPEVNLPQARHFIDLLGVLEEKTRGNRTAEEDGLIQHFLNELRAGFLAMQSRPPSDGPKPADS